MRCIHSTFLLLALAAAALDAQPPAVRSGSRTFTVFIQGRAVGTEDVTIAGSAEGWKITATGSLGAPFNVITRSFEMRYDSAWRPLELTYDAAINAEPVHLHTTFKDGAATSEISQAGQSRTKTDKVSPDAIVIPNPLFGAYEALAVRLGAMTPPAELRAYVAPQAEIAVRVNAVFDERLQQPGGPMDARRYQITFDNPQGPLDAEVWTDRGGRLLRFQVPAQGVDVVRQDIAGVSTRLERAVRPNDERVMAQAVGFNLATTISRPPALSGKPEKTSPKLPAIVLIGGSGPADRDETVAGIPIFGQLAGALADAGFIVARYDKRGAGQSGGRTEAATLSDYADDALAIVRSLKNQRDVDGKRIALVGHSEGGAVALIAAARRSGDVKAVVTIAAPGVPGAELILEQQKRALAQSKLSPAERQTAAELQQRILKAVISGEGWEGIPPQVRQRTDTPWYRSLLMFDPAEAVRRVEQPILIMQGELDTQVPPRHADKLAEYARARKGRRIVEVKKLAGVNHLLAPAKTGEVSEYAELADKSITPEVARIIAEWLKTLKPS